MAVVFYGNENIHFFFPEVIIIKTPKIFRFLFYPWLIETTIMTFQLRTLFFFNYKENKTFSKLCYIFRKFRTAQNIKKKNPNIFCIRSNLHTVATDELALFIFSQYSSSVAVLLASEIIKENLLRIHAKMNRQETYTQW